MTEILKKNIPSDQLGLGSYASLEICYECNQIEHFQANSNLHWENVKLHIIVNNSLNVQMHVNEVYCLETK